MYHEAGCNSDQWHNAWTRNSTGGREHLLDKGLHDMDNQNLTMVFDFLPDFRNENLIDVPK